MARYSDTRQVPIANEADFEDALQHLANAFDPSWLERNGTHPLQILWKRPDGLASTELFFVGASVRKLLGLNQAWVARTVKGAKQAQPNNRQGSTFEIVAAALFHAPPYQVVELAPANRPGYDLEVCLQEQLRICISLKSYKTSAHYAAFRKEAEATERTLRANLGKFCRHVVIDNQDGYPRQAAWAALRRALPAIVQQRPGRYVTDGGWHVDLRPLASRGGSFYEKKASYTLILAAPFHPNEQQNLVSKLEEAASNLTRKGKAETSTTVNMVFVRLPEDSSADLCAAWADDYLIQNSTAPISWVMLYQPAFTTDPSTHTSHVSHAFLSRSRPKVAHLISNLKPLAIELPVGVPQTQPTRRVLLANGTQIPIDGRYVYQSGHHYYVHDLMIGSEAEFGIESGVETHSVLRSGNGDMVLSAKGPPQDELLIL